MTAIGILGAGGRMGQAIARELETTPGATLAGGIDRGGDPAALAGQCDVLVDFSMPDGLQAHLDAAAAAGTPLLLGTTGLTAAHHQAIDAAAARVAVLQTANTSLGITLLAALAEEAARRLGPDWDAAILDVHHRDKKDAPSGTALLLGGAIEAGGGLDGRAIDYASLRGGSVAGDHQVIFAAEGERLELGHRAESRAIFARGAVKAALWLAQQPAGRYTMKDVLGL